MLNPYCQDPGFEMLQGLGLNGCGWDCKDFGSGVGVWGARYIGFNGSGLEGDK